MHSQPDRLLVRRCGSRLVRRGTRSSQRFVYREDGRPGARATDDWADVPEMTAAFGRRMAAHEVVDMALQDILMLAPAEVAGRTHLVHQPEGRLHQGFRGLRERGKVGCGRSAAGTTPVP